MFNNLKLLDKTRDAELEVNVHSSSKSTHCDKRGMLQGFGDVYIHKEGIAQILSFTLNRDIGYRITYDAEKYIFTIHTPIKQLRLRHSRRKLFYHNCLHIKRTITMVQTDADTSIVQTLDGNAK